MPTRFRPQTTHISNPKKTSIGKKPSVAMMNKNKRRSYKKYRSQGKVR